MSSTAARPRLDASTFTPDRKDPYLSLHHVTIYVRDLDKSIYFYKEQLGFDVVIDVRTERGRFVAVSPPDGTAIIGLVAPDAASEEHKLIGRPGVVVFMTGDVVAKYKEWHKRGVRFRHEPFKPDWGGMFTVFEDLDGNTFAMIGRDEITSEIEQRRRAIIEKQELESRTAQEFEIARQVQARLFPQNLPELRTLDYAGLCIQARQVGGDYYDFLHLGKERLGLVIGDISGKGIAAALLMVNLQANLRSQSSIALDEPQRLLHSVNKLFYENTADNAYASLFFAEYDDKTRRLRYANCGHLAALLIRDDGTLEKLDSTCTVLGLFNEWDCYMGERRMFSGDRLVLYTDGVTEAFDGTGDEFGEERLIETLVRSREIPSQALIQSVVEEIREFSPHEQHDDITLIAARCK